MPDWSQHGINGRGVLLDLARFFTRDGEQLSYDPWSTHGFSVADLEDCAKAQGVEFQQGDILLLRVGYMQRYYASTQEEKDTLPKKAESL